jgi:hypothetical protein
MNKNMIYSKIKINNVNKKKCFLRPAIKCYLIYFFRFLLELVVISGGVS